MRLRLALIAAAGVAAILLLAAWQVPKWLDWTRYRGTIEAFATATLGQPVTISGPISLTLLPQPVLTAAQVNVGGNGPADFSIRVDALRLRTALLPLIAGRVDARELVLRGPDLHLPWPAEPGMLRRPPPIWLAAFAARIESGRLTVGQLAFTGIDADLATLETGALSTSGTAQFSGQEWHFTAKLTAMGADGSAGLNVTLDGQGKANGLGASFSGQLSRDGTLAGSFASRGPNLAVLLPTPAVPFRADGRLTMGSGLVAVDDLALEIGNSPATGAVALRVAPIQRLDIALSASRLDLDAWLPVLLRAGTTIAGFEVPIGIDFSAEAAPWGGGTLEHVRAAFELRGKDMEVREATARLPGNATLSLSGRVVRGDAVQTRFDGDARLAAPVLRTTLRWIEEAMPGLVPSRFLAALPEGVAQRSELSAHVATDGKGIVLQRLEGTLDDIRVAGQLELKRGDPPALVATLDMDRLNLDPWLPRRTPNPAELNRMLVGFDCELRLSVHSATLAGTTIERLVVDTAVEAGSLMLRRAEAVIQGVQLAAAGILADGRLSGGKLSAVASDASGVADMLPATWRGTPGLWHGPARLELRAAGSQDALSLDVRLSAADARLEANPVVDLRSGGWSAALTLRHPGARRLITTLGAGQWIGLQSLPAWLGDGSLALVAHLAGGPARLSADSFDLTAAGLRASGDLALDSRGSEPHVSGHVDFDSLPLPRLDSSTRTPLPFGLLHGWRGEVQLGAGTLTAANAPAIRAASAVVSVADGSLRVEQFAGTLGTGSITGRLALDASADPPRLSVEAKARDLTITGPLANAPLDLLSGHAHATVQLAASGFSPSALAATLGGRATLTVSDGVVAGFDLFRLRLAVEKPDPKSAELAVRDALRSGATGFDRLEVAANLAHGDLALDGARMTGASGEAQLSGGINLAAQTLDVRVTMQPALPSPPEVLLHLTGPLDRPVQTPELAGLARWMAELAH